MRTLVIAFASLLAGTAAAQTPPPPPESEDIVVIGTGAADREKQIRDFVGALGGRGRYGPMARFDTTSVCPAAVGLREANNAAVAERMRQVAAEVGIRVAEPGCRPNVLVIVAPDKDEMIKALYKQYPIYFRDGSNRPIALPKQRRPATAWHLQRSLDPGGMPVAVNRDQGYEVVEGTFAPSRINAASRPIFLASVVVIELDSLAGLTTTQVADYAAMRAFAKIDPERVAKTSAPTILKVLDAPMDSMVPLTLTHWDLSYLKGLYASSEYRHATHQRSEIRDRIAKDLEKTQQGAE